MKIMRNFGNEKVRKTNDRFMTNKVTSDVGSDKDDSNVDMDIDLNVDMIGLDRQSQRTQKKNYHAKVNDKDVNESPSKLTKSLKFLIDHR